MTTVGRLYRFRATHSLPDFPEPWCFPHQHDYTVEVVAEGNTDTLVLDLCWALRGFLDGADLNAEVTRTTVEALAEHLLGVFNASAEIVAVTVWEDRQRWGRAEA